MGGMFKSDKYSEEKQFIKINKIITNYNTLKVIDINTLNSFLNELLFDQFDFVHNNNRLDVIDNFVYYITKNISVKDQKTLYLEQHYVDEDSPPWMVEGNLYTLKRWRKQHEEKEVKLRKIRTKEIDVASALQVINKYLNKNK